jgi:hypothetical protein
MRSYSSASAGLLLVLALVMLAGAYVVWRYPGLLARRNFPLNLLGDRSPPRRALPALVFAAMAVALVALAFVT